MRGLRFHRNMRADINNVLPYAWTAVSPQYAGGQKQRATLCVDCGFTAICGRT